MIHYTVAFSFKPGVSADAQLERVKAFLSDLRVRGKIYGYRLLQNRGVPPKTRLPPFLVDVMILDNTSFDLPFAEVAEIGIHSGRHGFMIEHVDQFIVEVFEELDNEAGGAVSRRPT